MRILRYGGFLAAIACCAQLSGQEFAVGYGQMQTSNGGGQNTFEFQYGYKQFLGDYMSVSTMWLNEGHVPDHHRDGSAWQAWGELPLAKDHIWLALGLGAYDFFDTEGGSIDSHDYHGLAPIYSASATWYPTDNGRLFVRISYNRVQPTGDIKTNTADIALGVWLGDKGRPGVPSPEEREPVTPWETSLLGGWSVQNVFDGIHQHAWSAEVRKGLGSYIDATASFIDERDLNITRRTGIATQIWAVNSFFHERLRLGIGVGVYSAVGPHEPVTPGQYLTPVVAPFFTPSLSMRLCDHWFARVNWNRVTGYGSDGPDADVVLFGLGYRWN